MCVCVCVFVCLFVSSAVYIQYVHVHTYAYTHSSMVDPAKSASVSGVCMFYICILCVHTGMSLCMCGQQYVCVCMSTVANSMYVCAYVYCVCAHLFFIFVLCASALLGFNALHEAIYRAAVNAKDPDTREKVIGQQVTAPVLCQTLQGCSVFVAVNLCYDKL